MKWILVLGASVFYPLCGLCADAGLMLFESHYKEMCVMAIGDEGAFYQFSLLQKNNPKSAAFVASFWMEKASNSSPELLDKIVNLETKRAGELAETLRKNDVAQAAKLKEMPDSLALFYIIYFYDHASEIKAMVERLNASSRDKEKVQGRLDELKKLRDDYFRAQADDSQKVNKKP